MNVSPNFKGKITVGFYHNKQLISQETALTTDAQDKQIQKAVFKIMPNGGCIQPSHTVTQDFLDLVNKVAETNLKATQDRYMLISSNDKFVSLAQTDVNKRTTCVNIDFQG